MTLILALLPDPVARKRLTRAAEMDRAGAVAHEIRWAGDWAEMQAVARESAAQIAVFDPYASGAFDLDACAIFHQAFPSVVLLPYGTFTPQCIHDVLLLAELGIRNIIVQGEDDIPLTLQFVLTESLSDSLPGIVLGALGELIPDALLPVVRHLLFQAHRPVKPGELAQIHYSNEKTLREHLRAVGLPSTNHLIIWARLFHAAHLLDGGARTVEAAALALDFPSRSALSNQLRRYVGVTPKELVERGGLAFLLKEFRRRCRDVDWKLDVRGRSRARNSAHE